MIEDRHVIHEYPKLFSPGVIRKTDRYHNLCQNKNEKYNKIQRLAKLNDTMGKVTVKINAASILGTLLISSDVDQSSYLGRL